MKEINKLITFLNENKKKEYIKYFDDNCFVEEDVLKVLHSIAQELKPDFKYYQRLVRFNGEILKKYKNPSEKIEEKCEVVYTLEMMQFKGDSMKKYKHNDQLAAMYYE